jgi:hypothetical protein
MWWAVARIEQQAALSRSSLSLPLSLSPSPQEKKHAGFAGRGRGRGPCAIGGLASERPLSGRGWASSRRRCSDRAIQGSRGGCWPIRRCPCSSSSYCSEAPWLPPTSSALARLRHIYPSICTAPQQHQQQSIHAPTPPVCQSAIQSAHPRQPCPLDGWRLRVLTRPRRLTMGASPPLFSARTAAPLSRRTGRPASTSTSTSMSAVPVV